MYLLIFLFLILSTFKSYADKINVLSGDDLPPYTFPDNNLGVDTRIVDEAFKIENIEVNFIKVPYIRVRKNYIENNIQCSSSTNESSGLKGFYTEKYLEYRDYAFELKSSHNTP